MKDPGARIRTPVFVLRPALIMLLGVTLSVTAGAQIGLLYPSVFKVATLLGLLTAIFLQRRLRLEPVVLGLIAICVASNLLTRKGINVPNFVNFSLTLLLLSFLERDFLHAVISKYAGVIFFLVAVSIPFFIVQRTAFQFIAMLPVSQTMESDGPSTGYLQYYNALIYTANTQPGDFRNRSIYWEPGVFFFNMVIAFYWQFFVEKRGSMRRFLVYAFGFLSCLSTSGLLAFPFLAWDYFYFGRAGGWKKYLPIGSLMIVAVAGAVAFRDFLFQYTFQKFTFENVSFFDRITSTINIVQLSLKNPLLGQGLTQDQFVTSAPFQMLYQLGFVFTIAYFIYLGVFFRKLSWLSLFPVIVLWANSEALAFAYVVTFMMIHGLKSTQPMRLGSLLLGKGKPPVSGGAIPSVSAGVPGMSAMPGKGGDAGFRGMERN